MQHPNANTTTTQTFDSAWDQLSADIVTVSGAVTTDDHYGAAWNLTGSTVTSALGPQTDLIQSFDAYGDHLAGQDQLVVQAQAGPQVFADAPGVATTWVLQPGDVNGDAFSGFVTAAMNPMVHDVLAFEGYGPTAALSQIDASHWQITAQGHATEVFTLAASLNPAAGDVVFKG